LRGSPGSTKCVMESSSVWYGLFRFVADELNMNVILSNPFRMKFLIDENADVFGRMLQERGHQIECVKKLKEEDPKFGHGYNVIKHADANKMALVTKDREGGKACRDNNIPCIWLSDEEAFERMVLPGLDEPAGRDSVQAG